MSTAKKALKRHAINGNTITGSAGAIQFERKLPDVLELTRSQVIALIALTEARKGLLKNRADADVGLEANAKAQTEILGEIGKVHSVTLEEIGNTYQFDGNMLVNAAALPKAAE